MINKISDWAYSLVNNAAIQPNETVDDQDACLSEQNELNNTPQEAPYGTVTTPKGHTEVISNIMIGAKQLWRMLVPKHPEAAQLWCKLCHKIDAAYPSKEKLQPIDTTTGKGMNI